MEYEPGLMWLTGVEVINHHTLSDFRIGHREALTVLFPQMLVVLSEAGLAKMNLVAHDGTKIRAQAGVDSFRREATVREKLAEARGARRGGGGATEEHAEGIEEMGLAHPARELRELEFGIRRRFDGVNADALLARVAPFLSDGFRLHGRGGHDQDKEFDGIDCFRELFPPAHAAFEQQAILLNGDVGCFGAEFFAQRAGELSAVFACV